MALSFHPEKGVGFGKLKQHLNLRLLKQLLYSNIRKSVLTSHGKLKYRLCIFKKHFTSSGVLLISVNNKIEQRILFLAVGQLSPFYRWGRDGTKSKEDSNFSSRRLSSLRKLSICSAQLRLQTSRNRLHWACSAIRVF